MFHPAAVPFINRKLFIAVIFTLTFGLLNAAEQPSDTSAVSATKGWRSIGLVSKVIDYLHETNKHELSRRPDFSFLAGPYYTSEKGAGLGLIVAGDYSTCPTDSLLPVSNVSLTGELATNNYYSVGINGVHIFPNNTHRINYNLDFVSFSTYFWGVGYKMNINDTNETPYNLFELSLTADYEWQLWRNAFFGPAVEVSYTNARDVDDKALWGDADMEYPTISAGIIFQVDTRDNLTAPKRGYLFEFKQLFSPRFLGNGNNSFSITELSYNIYKPLWQGATIAGRIHGSWSYGDTPWSKLPVLGGDAMRGYYEGRYRDKCATDVTVELRQHVYRRSGVAVWSGVGTVYDKFSEIRFDRLLPEIGVGYRWEFKRNTNIRLDIGFGKHSSGFQIGVNEAF